jgi:branched-chain amino acid transport system permease protein
MTALLTVRKRPVPNLLFPMVLAILVVVGPWLGIGPYWTREIILITTLALIVSGLNLSLGYAGELALGQVAIFAVGAYVSGYFAINVSTDLLLGLAVAIVAALVVGLVTGIPGIRLGGWALAMTSFFLVLLVPDLITIFQKYTGGQSGLVAIPQYTVFGHVLDTNQYYLATVVVGLVWFALFRNLVTSRHGSAFLVLRQNPTLASSLGISVQRLKLTAYALGAIPAGIAGVFFGNLDHFISPSDPGPFTFSMSIAVLAASVLGGSTSIYGAVVGATLLELGPLHTASFQKYSDVVYGVFLLAFGVLLSQGLAGIGRTLVARRSHRPEPSPTAGVRAQRRPLDIALPGQTLSIAHVEKRFGGLVALDDVSLAAQPGRVTSIIGPNGSGKTTLLNMISGFYTLSDGTISLGQQVISGQSPHGIARRGIARTFQTPIIPKDLSVIQTVATGRYRPSYSSMPSTILRLPSFRRITREDRAEAERILEALGIGHLSDQAAVDQPLGIRRLIEVARAVIASPSVVLFDEIAAGLDDDEVEDLAGVIDQLRTAGATVLLVEHNFKLVLELSDEIHVLANGRLVASGPPAEIASHPAVLQEYLGITPEAAGLDATGLPEAPIP